MLNISFINNKKETDLKKSYRLFSQLLYKEL